MRVILRSDLDGLGKRGDIVEVADGHARNYLLPKGLAIARHRRCRRPGGRMREARDQRDADDREAAKAIATKLVPKIITIAGEGRAGGQALRIGHRRRHRRRGARRRRASSSSGVSSTSDPIKTLGQHTVTATLHSDVRFPIPSRSSSA